MEKTMQYAADAGLNKWQEEGNGHNESNEDYAGGNGHGMKDYNTKFNRFNLRGLEKKLLTREEEADLFRKLERAKTEKKRILCRNEIVRYNLRLVVSIANDYSFLCDISGLETAELVNAGAIGLVESIEKHDYKRGFKLSTHAVKTIRRHIRRAYDNESSLIRIPIYVRQNVYKIKKAEEDLLYKLKRKPTIKEIARETRMKISMVKGIKNFMNSDVPKQPLSLDMPLNEDEGEKITLADCVSGNHKEKKDIYAKAKSFVLREKLRESIKELKENERKVLYSRFGLDGNGFRTLEETGGELHISKERARQIQKTAIKKLKEKID